MSLISEALKKAQRMRTAESAPGGGGEHAFRRGRTMANQSLVWVVAGTAALVSAAVVTTVFLLRPAPTALSAAKAAPAPAATAAIANSSSGTLVSVPPPSAPAKAVETAPSRIEAASPMADGASEPPKPTAATAAVAKAASPSLITLAGPPAADNASRPDLRIQTFVDSIKVGGIRSSGAESKVLMNDHVYRVNDIVDRSLNLRLTEVRPDRLTFMDETGATYTKSF